jgi:DNA segregation ATPase FtsK/SpoIIIE, S-DNA-T family
VDLPVAKKRGPGRTPKKRSSEWAFGLQVAPETLREIGAIILVVAALLVLLSLLGLAGSFGDYLTSGGRWLIGFTVFLIAPALLFIGLRFLLAEDNDAGKGVFVGVGLAFFALASLMHLGVSSDEASSVASAGGGGGMTGYAGSVVLKQFLSTPAAAIILLGMLLVGILLATNTRFRALAERVRGLRPDREAAPEVKINESAPPLEAPPATGRPAPKQEEALRSSAGDDGWELPPYSLLETNTTRADSGNIRANAQIIQKTLADFGVEVQMLDVNVGPTVTQYTLKPAQGIKVGKITNLDKDLALALAAHPVRVEAPIPGKSAIGVEIPNKKAAQVRLKELLESPEFQNRGGGLTLALGRDVSGQVQVADLAKMPHLLIAGATGAGKSVGINSMLFSLLYQNSPRDLRLILVDPKRVELSTYNGIPHLLTPVITTPDKTVSALKWAVAEMERRYQIFAEEGKRNIAEYNTSSDARMPFIVIVIDELADLMAVAAAEVEGLIIRLAQMARATGIHLIVATQRPSVDVITGLIKANITSRIAFAVASQIDSRTIIDTGGAEKLLGSGDMLFLAGDISKPRRLQGAYISEKELSGVTGYLKDQEEPEYNEEVLKMPSKVSVGGAAGAIDDDLFEEAVEMAIRSGKLSASLLQRRLRVGYARAARLLDLLEERGVIGPADGAKPREVLISNLHDALGDDGQAEVAERDEY